MVTIKRKPVTPHNHALLKSSHGDLIGILIGIDKYDQDSGFGPLKTCSNDAIMLRETLHRVSQLNADKDRIKILTSESNAVIPSRGEIIKATKQLVEIAETNDRLLFYYSGHGHKLTNDSGQDDFYLVPQDVYDSEDPHALIDFKLIEDILNNSKAKQKIIILDACLSGPILSGKKLSAAKYSPSFLAEYLAKTKGIAIISSSSGDEASYTKSPSPDLSLFTYFLLKALEGNPDALDNSNILTLQSLFDYLSTEVPRFARSLQKTQTPNLKIEVNKTLVFGDFGLNPIFSPENDLGVFPISLLVFLDSRGSMKVKDILTNIRFYSYGQEYLEKKVNENLGDHLKDEFDSLVAELINTFDFQLNEVSYVDNELTFPGGTYFVSYIAENTKSGRRNDSLSLASYWFQRPQDILVLLELFNIAPEGVTFLLNKPYGSEDFVRFFKTQGWRLSSFGSKVEMIKERYKIRVEDDSITIWGITPIDIWGNNVNDEKKSITFQALTLLTKG